MFLSWTGIFLCVSGPITKIKYNMARRKPHVFDENGNRILGKPGRPFGSKDSKPRKLLGKQPKRRGRPVGTLKVSRNIEDCLPIPDATPEAPFGFLPDGVTPRKRRRTEDVAMFFAPLKVVKYHRITGPRVIQRREKKYDYLKYHRIVMAWARKKYNVTTIDLEMMFFLYSEDIFTKSKFKEYDNVMPMDEIRLARMIEAGWIKTWRSDRDARYKYYELSSAAKGIVKSIYQKLNGEVRISELKRTNELMNRANVTHKKYAIGIKKMNREMEAKKQQSRHQARYDREKLEPKIRKGSRRPLDSGNSDFGE